MHLSFGIGASVLVSLALVAPLAIVDCSSSSPAVSFDSGTTGLDAGTTEDTGTGTDTGTTPETGTAADTGTTEDTGAAADTGSLDGGSEDAPADDGG
jgi:hypothetical protein